LRVLDEVGRQFVFAHFGQMRCVRRVVAAITSSNPKVRAIVFPARPAILRGAAMVSKKRKCLSISASPFSGHGSAKAMLHFLGFASVAFVLLARRYKPMMSWKLKGPIPRAFVLQACVYHQCPRRNPGSATSLRRAMTRKTGAEIDKHFRFFDTICGATQDRQDALEKLLREPFDLLL